MVRLRTVQECTVRDDADDYLESLSPEDRRPSFKTNALGPSIKHATDEERAIVRKIGLSE